MVPFGNTWFLLGYCPNNTGGRNFRNRAIDMMNKGERAITGKAKTSHLFNSLDGDFTNRSKESMTIGRLGMKNEKVSFLHTELGAMIICTF